MSEIGSIIIDSNGHLAHASHIRHLYLVLYWGRPPVGWSPGMLVGWLAGWPVGCYCSYNLPCLSNTFI